MAGFRAIAALKRAPFRAGITKLPRPFPAFFPIRSQFRPAAQVLRKGKHALSQLPVAEMPDTYRPDMTLRQSRHAALFALLRQSDPSLGESHVARAPRPARSETLSAERAAAFLSQANRSLGVPAPGHGALRTL